MQDFFPCLRNESSNTVKQSNHIKLALITFNSSENNFSFKKKQQISLRNFRKWLWNFIKSRKPRLACVTILIVNSIPSLFGRAPLVPFSALYLCHKFLKIISCVNLHSSYRPSVCNSLKKRTPSHVIFKSFYHRYTTATL